MKNLKLKHFSWLLLPALLVACKKDDVSINSDPASKSENLEVCDFGIKNFNLNKRIENYDELTSAARRKNPKQGGDTTTTPVTPTPPPPTITTELPAGYGVVLLDFDGQYVSGTYWNNGNPISASPANMTSTEIQNVVTRVTEDFSPFTVVVTTDESLYNLASPYKRIRVIITESWEWFGQAGGVAYINSFTWGNNTPAWVFSSMLSYSSKNVAEATSHETGHTLGLYHQAVYENGVKTNDYNPGIGSGETSWAPIMGNSYYRNLSLWHNGINSNGQTQDDINILSSNITYKTDDAGNTISTAIALGTGKQGLINTTNDADLFYVDGAINNLSLQSNGNVDLKYTVYNSSGAVITSNNDVNLLGVTNNLSLPYGRYYISVTTTPNAYTSTYGMLGRYYLSVY